MVLLGVRFRVRETLIACAGVCVCVFVFVYWYRSVLHGRRL